MKNLNSRYKKLGIAIAAMSALVTLSFNCAPNMFESAQYWDGTLASNSAFTKPDSPWVLLTSNQQFQSMLNVTGQSNTMTSSQKAEFDLRTAALSGNENIAGINGPLMIGTTSLAGEVCNGMLMKEKATAADARAFFNDVDFTKPLSQNSEDAYNSAAEKMAQAFYGRDLTGDEFNTLSAYYTEFTGGIPADTATQTANLYLTLCAGMLSSFDSQTY